MWHGSPFFVKWYSLWLLSDFSVKWISCLSYVAWLVDICVCLLRWGGWKQSLFRSPQHINNAPSLHHPTLWDTRRWALHTPKTITPRPANTFTSTKKVSAPHPSKRLIENDPACTGAQRHKVQVSHNNTTFRQKMQASKHRRSPTQANRQKHQYATWMLPPKSNPCQSQSKSCHDEEMSKRERLAQLDLPSTLAPSNRQFFFLNWLLFAQPDSCYSAQKISLLIEIWPEIG